MTTQLREGINKKPPPKLEGSVESDEIYIVAGHKGNPEAVRDKRRKGRRNLLKGARGRGTLEKIKMIKIFTPSSRSLLFSMIQLQPEQPQEHIFRLCLQ